MQGFVLVVRNVFVGDGQFDFEYVAVGAAGSVLLDCNCVSVLFFVVDDGGAEGFHNSGAGKGACATAFDL